MPERPVHTMQGTGVSTGLLNLSQMALEVQGRRDLLPHCLKPETMTQPQRHSHAPSAPSREALL